MSEQRSDQSDNAVEWLIAVLALVAAVAIALLYTALPDHSTNEYIQFLRAALPSAFIVLLTVPILYFILFRRGIPARPWTTRFERKIVTLRDRVAEDGTSPHTMKYQGVKAFYPNFREIDWSDLLGSARSLDIIVCYWDSWGKANWEILRDFFARGGAMRIFVTNPHAEDAMRWVAARFPEYPLETVKFKVVNTGIRLQGALTESHSNTARLEVFYFDQPLNYSAVKIDNDALLLSVYEQFRQKKIDSSAVLLDLNSSAHLRAYWDKEIGLFMRHSRSVSVDELAESAQDLGGDADRAD